MKGSFVMVSHSMGEYISRSTEKIAKEKGANAVLWHQGDPIWFIQKEEDGEDYKTVKRVQITPFWYPDKPEALYFVPQIYLVPKRENVVKVQKQIYADHVQSIELQELRGISEEEFHDKFHKLAVEIWNHAQNYHVDSITLENIPRPNQHSSPEDSSAQ